MFFAAVIAVCAILQATALNYLALFNVKPDLLLICAMLACIFFEPVPAVILSVFAGFLKDTLSINAFGLHTCLFFIWGFLAVRLSREISFENDYVRFALITAASILNNISVRAVFLFSGKMVSWGIFLRILFLEALYTAFIAGIILRIQQKQVRDENQDT